MTMFLVVMTLHVLCAALWVAIAVFGAVFLTPAARDLGPDGMKIMLALRKRGFVAFVPIIATITVLSGFWLYWRFTAGFSPEVSRSHAGMTFGTGGILGLTALIIGGAVLSRSVVQAVRLPPKPRGCLRVRSAPTGSRVRRPCASARRQPGTSWPPWS